MTWTCLSRANGIDLPTMRLMKEAGCRKVYLGLESGSQATLDLMRKQITVEQGIRTTQLYREAGIDVAAFFIVGYPGESVAAIEDTFRLALTLPLDEISFNVPVPLPGSTLYRAPGRPGRGQGTGSGRTRSPSSTRPRSTRRGSGAGSTRRWRAFAAKK